MPDWDMAHLVQCVLIECGAHIAPSLAADGAVVAGRVDLWVMAAVGDLGTGQELLRLAAVLVEGGLQ